MKRLTFLIVGTLLASTASAEGWRADRNQFRVFEEIKTAHQTSHNQHKQRQIDNKQQEKKKRVDKPQVSKKHVDKRHVSKQHQNSNRSKHNRNHVSRDRHNAERNHHNRSRYSYSQSHNRRDQHSNRGGQQHQSRKWQTVSAFRGRSGKVVTREFRVGEKVNALSIQGTKRAMVIRRAHALMGNGRWVRLGGLEGHIANGERAKHRLHNSRFVRRVELEVAPGRYKRAYGNLQVSSAR